MEIIKIAPETLEALQNAPCAPRPRQAAASPSTSSMRCWRSLEEIQMRDRARG